MIITMVLPANATNVFKEVVTPKVIEYIQKYIQRKKNYSLYVKPIIDEEYPYITGFEFNIIIKIGKE